MKKVYLAFAFVLGFVLTAGSASAECYIERADDQTTNRGDAKHGDSFRSYVSDIINKGRSTCDIDAGWPDKKAGFDAGIYVTTPELASNDEEGITKITLAGDFNLTIKSAKNVVFGNPSVAALENGNTPKGAYYADYISDMNAKFEENDIDADFNVLQHFGFVEVDGRAAKLKCSLENEHKFWVREGAVFADAGERMGNGCWENGGNGFVCDGTKKEGGGLPTDYDDPNGEDYTKWCNSDTVEDSGTGPGNGGGGRPDFEFDPDKWLERFTKYYLDRDGDGFGYNDPDETGDVRISFRDVPPNDGQNWVENNDDCDDSDASINPDASELCDGADNDCNGQTDEGYSDLGESCSDGVGECSVSGEMICSADGSATECSVSANDEGSDEICDDGLDNDCDGDIDEDCTTNEGPSEETGLCDNLDDEGNAIDDDGDGLANCDDSDCSSDAACLVVDNPESDCTDGLDNNDDDLIDCYDSTCWDDIACVVNVAFDSDGDGYTIENGDCDDAAASVFPNAEESCNGIDDNCDGQIDEDLDQCVDPGQSADAPTSGCGCYLGNQHPPLSQKLFLFGLAMIPFLWALRKRQTLKA